MSSSSAYWGYAYRPILTVTGISGIALAAAMACEFIFSTPPQRIQRAAISIVMLACFATAIVFFGHPSERLTSNNDQGLYSLTGLNILKQGSSSIAVSPDLTPELIQTLSHEQPVQALHSGKPTSSSRNYMGFILSDNPKPYLSSQFPSAFPASIACAGTLSGQRHAFWINWFWLLMLAMIAAEIGLRAGGNAVGFFAFLAVTICPLHIWLANSLYAELMLATCSAATILLSDRAWRSRQALLPLCAASVWCSLAILTKIDGVVIVGLFSLFTFVLSRTRKTCLFALAAIPPLAAFGFSLSPYQLETISAAVTNYWKLLAIILPVAALTGLLAYRLKDRVGKWKEHYILAAMLLLILVASCFFYFVFPDLLKGDKFYYWPKHQEILSLRGETFRRIGWYLTPVGLFAGLTGQIILLKKAGSRNLVAVSLLVIAGLGCLFLLAYDIMNNPLQPYAMRRFVSYSTLPLSIGIAMWCTPLLKRKVAYAMSAIGCLLIIGILSWQIAISFRMNTRGDHGGYLDGMSTMAAQIPSDWVIVDQNSALADISASLQILHDKQVLLIPRKANTGTAKMIDAFLAKLKAEGKPVTVLSEIRRPTVTIPSLPELQPCSNGEIVASSLSMSYDKFPQEGCTHRWRYWVSIAANPAPER